MKPNHRFAEIANHLAGAQLYTANDTDYSVRDENNNIVAQWFPEYEIMTVTSERPYLNHALNLTFKN